MPSENKLPSISQIQKLVRDKTSVEFYCLDGKSSRFSGVIKWFDGEAVLLKQEDGGEITLWKHALLGYRVKKAK